MIFDFDKYLEAYRDSGYDGDSDDDGDNDGPLQKLNIQCQYYDIENMANFVQSINQSHKYTAIHVNIRSLPGKHDQLQTMVAEIHDLV